MKVGNLFFAAFNGWQEDKAPTFGAALAYYTVFSIGPLILLIMAIVGLFYSASEFQSQLYSQIGGILGKNAAETVKTVASHGQKNYQGIVSAIMSFIALALGASGVFGQLKETLNSIWRVKNTGRGGIITMIKDRFLSFSMVVVIGFLLLVSLILTSITSLIGNWFKSVFPVAPFFIHVLDFFVSLFLTTIFFAAIYAVLPDIRIGWRRVLPGAFIAALLFSIGKFVISFYIGNAAVGSSYGAAGSLIVILLWVYYTTQILFFGAEYTKAEVLAGNIKVEPKKFATLNLVQNKNQSQRLQDSLEEVFTVATEKVIEKVKRKKK